MKAGALAVTVSYSDSAEIQILPAIRTMNGVRIADPGSDQWSNVVRPDKFAQELSDVDRACNGRVILTIKLAKAIADCFIRRPCRKITGYHMESLAIEAFRSYKGPLDPKTMLVHLFGSPSKLSWHPSWTRLASPGALMTTWDSHRQGTVIEFRPTLDR